MVLYAEDSWTGHNGQISDFDGFDVYIRYSDTVCDASYPSSTCDLKYSAYALENAIGITEWKNTGILNDKDMKYDDNSVLPTAEFDGITGICYDSNTIPLIPINYDLNVETLTMIAYVYPNDPNNIGNQYHFQWILTHDYGGLERAIILSDSSFGFNGAIAAAIGSTAYTSTLGPLIQNEWQFLAVTYAGGDGGDVTIYYGTLNDNTLQTQTVQQNGLLSGSTDLVLNGHPSGGPDFIFMGCISDVEICSTTYDSETILEKFNEFKSTVDSFSSAPTTTPTVNPTMSTKQPTNTPTKAPTKEPSAHPTSTPTTSPFVTNLLNEAIPNSQCDLKYSTFALHEGQSMTSWKNTGILGQSKNMKYDDNSALPIDTFDGLVGVCYDSYSLPFLPIEYNTNTNVLPDVTMIAYLYPHDPNNVAVEGQQILTNNNGGLDRGLYPSDDRFGFTGAASVGVGSIYTSTLGPLIQDEWQFMAVVYSGTTTATTSATVYYGSLNDNTLQTQSVSTNFVSSGLTRMALNGAEASNIPDLTFIGCISDVEICSTAYDSTTMNQKFNEFKSIVNTAKAGPQKCDSNVVGDGWQLVRHVPASSSEWHPATDNLVGTDQYGIYSTSNDAPAFSTKYDDISYNEFLFASGDCSKWLIAMKDEVLRQGGGPFEAKICSSDQNPSIHVSNWWNRPTVVTDPWIVNTYSIPEVLYGEGSITDHPDIRTNYDGADVYIRYADPVCNGDCDLIYSTFDFDSSQNITSWKNDGILGDKDWKYDDNSVIPTDTVDGVTGICYDSESVPMLTINYDTYEVLTLIAYIYPYDDALSGWSRQYILSNSNNFGPERGIIIGSSSTYGTDGAVAADTGAQYISSLGPIKANEWQFVAVTYSGGQNDLITIYYGTLDDNTVQSQSRLQSGSVSGRDVLTLTGVYPFDSQKFKGCISGVEVCSSVYNFTTMNDKFNEFKSDISSLSSSPTTTPTKNPTTPNEIICDPSLVGEGWQLVRHVPASHNGWHPATDNARGSEVYGTYSELNDAPAFSIKYDTINFNEFLFATGDCSYFLRTTKQYVWTFYQSAYNGRVCSSNTNTNGYFSLWYNRPGEDAEPWYLNDILFHVYIDYIIY